MKENWQVWQEEILEELKIKADLGYDLESNEDSDLMLQLYFSFSKNLAQRIEQLEIDKKAIIKKAAEVEYVGFLCVKKGIWK